MQSRNKAVIIGLLVGAVTWNFSRALSFGVEAGALAGWTAVLPDLDSAYEFACDHTKYPPAAMAVPFGRFVTDRLHSCGHSRFLHSVLAFVGFFAVGAALTLLPRDNYARMEQIFAIWIIFALTHYLIRAVLRDLLREIVRVVPIIAAGIAWVIWEIWYGRMPGYHLLPAKWFLLAWAGGIGGNIVAELLSSRGVPLLWPIKWQLKVPLLGEMGGLRESWVVGVFLACWTWWWWNHYPSIHPITVDLKGMAITFVPFVIGLFRRFAQRF